jgi:hypothetical protein
MKFEYSPGLFGYGLKGADGSAGLSGMGLYFTDYNPYSYMTVITYAINNNESLISTSMPGTKLPSGRSYVNGEVFIDYRGWVWEISTNNKRFGLSPISRLLAGDYFVESGGATSNGFERYYNDPSAKYIIDAVRSMNAKPNYTLFPSNIYNIFTKNFARIEYSDVIDSCRNAFTVYSSGEIELSDDHQSIAIVREISGNTFRIGNLTTSNTIRNTNLTLDISSLKKNTNDISLNTPTGEILSNKEYKANSLFGPIANFNDRPNSFIATSDATNASIGWVLCDFTLDPCIVGNLYVYEKNPADPIANSSRTMIFHNLDSSGYINFSNATTDTSFCYYMNIIKDGWMRNSIVKEFKVGEANKILTITQPSTPYIIEASADGRFWISGTPYSAYPLQFTTNSSNWNTSITPLNSWINCVPASGTLASTTTDVSVKANTSGWRQGYVYITSGPLTQTVTVRQDSGARSLSSSPSHIRFNQYGTLIPGYTNVIRVTASIDVSWQASTSDAWIFIIDPGTVTGSGTFNFMVDPGSDDLGIIYVYSIDISTYVRIIRETV